ncbi:RING/U-box superfamily protein [Hirschfeldia incana]|nr:RING/U-box superfamily protein [Hirschfeldia incana]
MFLESVIRFSQLIGESLIIASVVVFFLRLLLRLACFLASRPWRRYRTFTIRRRLRLWKRTAEEEDSSTYCSICLQDTADGEKMRRLTACSHCFHADCIDPWLEKRSTCPLCRAQVPPLPTGNPLLALIVPPGVIELFTKGTFAYDA